MEIVRSITRMQRLADRWRARGLTVGFLPTLGALHAAHLALVRASLARTDRTVVSVFVNPIQFGPREDLAAYPRPFARDRRLLARAGVHALFAPSVAAMYPKGFATSVEVGGSVARGLCAPFRPGHFRGVTTVVAKLLHAVRPHAAFFGAKDRQQALIVSRMARDLDFGVRIVVRPTVRESDGLAMSSRNAYLSPAERRIAPALHAALQAAAAAVRRGARDPRAVRVVARRTLARVPGMRVQYLDIVDARTLAPFTRLRGAVLLAAAAHLGRTRLIDNLVVRAR